MIVNALAGKPLPVYGDGQQIRDWLYVKDHCTLFAACWKPAFPGKPIISAAGMRSPTSKLCITICRLLDKLRPRDAGTYRNLIISSRIVPAMTGAMPSMRARLSANWAGNLPRLLKQDSSKPSNGIWTIAAGSTDVKSGAYRTWIEKNYTERDLMKILLFGKTVSWDGSCSAACCPWASVIALDSGSKELCGDFTRLDGIAQVVRVVAPDVIVNAGCLYSCGQGGKRAGACPRSSMPSLPLHSP